MNEIIWAMNEKNNSLEDLIYYTRSYSMEYCDENNLQCEVRLPDPIPHLMVSGEMRRNIFLAIKESLHNIVKHAGASKVSIEFTITDHLHIKISDNGKGIDTTPRSKDGNGLLNMQKRVTLLGGTLNLRNYEGLTIEFNIPLKGVG
jgi:signal transduction histidine kinase